MSEPDKQANLDELITLLRARNQIDRQISQLIDRPASNGHLGEYLAASIFDIELHASATNKASDGVFRSGALAGRSVNIKCYGRRESLLDIVNSVDAIAHPHYYLAMTGPKGNAASSRGRILQFAIDGVYLFDAHKLLAEQLQRNVKLGTASSMTTRQWDDAMIYPTAVCKLLEVDERQRSLLSKFASTKM